MMRKIRLCLLLTVLVICSCGANNVEETVSMYDLREAMLAADPALPDMVSVSDADEDARNLFSYLSDMDYEKVEHYFLSYSAEGKADEIAVITVKNPANAEEAKASLQEHLDSRIKLLKEYEPEEVERLEKGQIFTKKQYAVLIICEDTDKVKKEFNNYVSSSGEKAKE